jgi:hypothetical protein
VSLRSSKELVGSREEFEPDCEGLIVTDEEDEGCAGWVGVGGRDIGRPLGVSRSSGRSSQISSVEGKRGRLFR